MPQSSNTTHTATRLDRQGAATLTLTGAKSMNILGTPALTELTVAVNELAARADVRTLVLRGSGEKAFIGGADIHEMAALMPNTAEQFITRLKAFCEALRQFPVPVIARIPGWCLGGDLEVAMACDLRISSNAARFGMPEVAVGIPSVIHAALLPRLIGGSRATWLLLTGEQIDAATALAWGLVHNVVDPSDLDAAVNRVADRFAELGGSVVRQQKKLLRSWEDMPLDQAITESVPEFGVAFGTGEPQKIMAEFVNRKRSP